LITATAIFAIELKDKFPDFNLPDLEGNDISHTEIIGQKPVLISFWATWCKPCKKELVNLLPYYEEMANDIEFVAITVDGARSKSRVKSWVRKEKLPYKVLYDTAGDLKLKAGVMDIPVSFILDKDGSIVYKSQGYKLGDEHKIAAELKKLISTTKADNEKEIEGEE
jgi:peroxiredoxin